MTVSFINETSNNIGDVPVWAGGGTINAVIRRSAGFFRVDITLTAVRIPVTDAGVSGSSGAVKLFTFKQGGVAILGARQNYTSFTEGAALTTAAGDAAFVLGLGSAEQATAADGVLGATQDNLATSVAVTLVAGAGAGTLVEAATATLDGTTTAVDVWLNFSGSAATIDATDYIEVTGTVSFAGTMLADD